MDIYIYFCLTILAFVGFLGFPLLLLKPWKRKQMINQLVDHGHLQILFSKRYAGGDITLRIKNLVDATAVDNVKLGNQDYFELKFESFRDSLNFKKAVLLAGICMETHITIIREGKEFFVIFLAPHQEISL